MEQEKKDIIRKVKKGNRRIRRIIPFLAPFFFAHFPLPAGSYKTKSENTHISGATAEALRFAAFQVDVYKLYEEIGLEKSGLTLDVFNDALLGYLNLKAQGQLSDKKLLTVVDFNKPSTEKRLWVIDLADKKVLFNSLVAHGKNSGENLAEQFDNTVNSEKSSLGFYVTQDIYMGKHGTSLKLVGMDENFNTNALERCVVMHGADYVSDAFITQHGRLGRSQGCPALPMENHRQVIEAVKGKTCLFIHANKKEFNSDYLDAETALAYYTSVGNTLI
ncbi:murein L,D-transpeptidase catalytic domain family protein [Adhaeribacter radiodurans]|uniref:Murein L,D-transpeptidase catalytic domain family protein n=1 Tax=Adhaeribacter radiodurans TaxID=2745197 RepID=A0A7L7LBU1_9BACT|nr:murein L,D-transpeptidase catalytic domain family protein [Adhaeribacter radiodurans]QMU30243.1 murein L,D-transpeptidase catalytic domain family protein [Adhaeribacter radiodurans]